MVQALPFITDEALSLDGGMNRSCGVFSLGKREDVDVRFLRLERSAGLDEHVEIEKQIRDAQWKKETILDEIKREGTLLDIAKHNFRLKKNDFLNFLVSSSFAAQIHNAAFSVPR